MMRICTYLRHTVKSNSFMGFLLSDDFSSTFFSHSCVDSKKKSDGFCECCAFDGYIGITTVDWIIFHQQWIAHDCSKNNFQLHGFFLAIYSTLVNHFD